MSVRTRFENEAKAYSEMAHRMVFCLEISLETCEKKKTELSRKIWP